MHYVYVPQSLKDNRFYIGSTDDLERRIREHNVGKTKSLKYRTPLKLVYQEVCSTRLEARRREYQIKSYKGREAFKKLIMGR